MTVDYTKAAEKMNKESAKKASSAADPYLEKTRNPEEQPGPANITQLPFTKEIKGFPLKNIFILAVPSLLILYFFPVLAVIIGIVILKNKNLRQKLDEYSKRDRP